MGLIQEGEEDNLSVIDSCQGCGNKSDDKGLGVGIRCVC